MQLLYRWVVNDRQKHRNSEACNAGSLDKQGGSVQTDKCYVVRFLNADEEWSASSARVEDLLLVAKTVGQIDCVG